MYTLKKEYKGQNVIVYTPNNQVIKLESASQEEFKIAYEIKGNEKFISKTNSNKESIKEKEEKVVDELVDDIEDKPVAKRGRPKL